MSMSFKQIYLEIWALGLREKNLEIEKKKLNKPLAQNVWTVYANMNKICKYDI